MQRHYNFIYMIRHRTSGLVKIGVTNNWQRRSAELGVGTTTEAISVAHVGPDAMTVETSLHRRFAGYRLPQSEWFQLSEDQVNTVRTVFGYHRAHWVELLQRGREKRAQIKPVQQVGPWRSKPLTRFALLWIVITLLCGISGAGITPFMTLVAPCLLWLARVW